MQTLSKADLTQKTAHVDTLERTWADLDAAVDAYNALVAGAWQVLQTTLDTYNTAVDDANEWREGIAAAIQEEIDEHAEKWQEGERGQAFLAWQEAWHNDELDTISLEDPEPLELDVSDQADLIDGLPDAPE